MAKTDTITDREQDLLFSLESAYEEDPSPESGRTYMANEEEYETACALLERGLLREVTFGVSSNVRWAHFGLTDDGFDAVEAL